MPLRELNLGNNKWLCDCKLRWLPAWYKEKQQTAGTAAVTVVGRTVCDGPGPNPGTSFTGLKGKPLLNNDNLATKFQCMPKVYPNYAPTLHNVKEGGNVTLECKFESDPKGQARWLYGERSASTVLRPQPGYFESQSSGGTQFVARLTITSLTAKDSRLYKCEVSNDRGVASLEHRVKVDTSRSALIFRRILLIIGIAAVIVITCALMIGGVCFYHYTHSSRRNRAVRNSHKLGYHQQQQSHQNQHQQLTHTHTHTHCTNI